MATPQPPPPGPFRGRPPYGFALDGTPHPQRAPIIRQAAERIAGGGSLTGTVRWLNDQALPAPDGGRWTAPTLSRLLVNPRLAGLDNDGHPTGGPQLLPPALHRQLAAAAAARRRYRRNQNAANMLTGLLRCGRCGTALHHHAERPGRAVYRCRSGRPGATRGPSVPGTSCGRVRIDAAVAHAAVRAHGARAANLLGAHLLGRQGGRPARWPATLAALTAQRAALDVLVAGGLLEPADTARLRARMTTRHDTAQADAAATLDPDACHPDWWHTAPDPAVRTAVAALAGHLTVLAGPGGPHSRLLWDPDPLADPGPAPHPG